MENNFAAFILTHGRPDNVKTFDTLKKCGYTGKVFIVIDNEDKTAAEYRKKYGDIVIEFDKLSVAKRIDEGDNFNDRRAIIYARNECFEIAKKLGVEYFIELDDDYTAFCFKYNSEGVFKESPCKNLDKIFNAMLKFYKNTTALSIAFAQNGDFIGGKNSKNIKSEKLLRKCMNTFICSTKRPFEFFGRINEDVNTYTNLGGRGGLFLTDVHVAIIQGKTQKSKGGMSDIYEAQGTYVKSFYSVMYSPSCVEVALMGDKHKRLHHRVSWNNAVPVILHESFKKQS